MRSFISANPVHFRYWHWFSTWEIGQNDWIEFFSWWNHNKTSTTGTFVAVTQSQQVLCVTAMQRNAERKTQWKKEQLLDAEKRRNATQREKRIAPWHQMLRHKAMAADGDAWSFQVCIGRKLGVWTCLVEEKQPVCCLKFHTREKWRQKFTVPRVHGRVVDSTNARARARTREAEVLQGGGCCRVDLDITLHFDLWVACSRLVSWNPFSRQGCSCLCGEATFFSQLRQEQEVKMHIFRRRPVGENKNGRKFNRVHCLVVLNLKFAARGHQDRFWHHPVRMCYSPIIESSGHTVHQNSAHSVPIIFTPLPLAWIPNIFCLRVQRSFHLLENGLISRYQDGLRPKTSVKYVERSDTHLPR